MGIGCDTILRQSLVIPERRRFAVLSGTHIEASVSHGPGYAAAWRCFAITIIGMPASD